MGMFKLLILFTLCFPALADTGLDALRTSMMGMRELKPSGPRGATQQLTIAKHQLRDWVESRLQELPPRGDEGLLQRQLNGELGKGSLFCGDNAENSQPCPERTLLGFLEELKFHRSRGFLILQTGFGVECGFDESAYIYSHSDEGWRRVWQTEQNTYTEKAYKPQTIHEILISPYSKANDYVVLTLGTQPWCSSNWHDVYYRAFRLGPDPSAAPLVEGIEYAYLGVDHPIQGSVTRSDLLVEFRIGSIDVGVHNRPAIRYYRIDGEQVKRIDPLALSPRDFVDEWLTHDWQAAAFWSESANRVSMRDSHKRLHKDFVSGEFIYPTMHCPGTPDIWQVGIDFAGPSTPIDTTQKGTYFLVRWQPPYHFRMFDVRDRPLEACSEEDREVDNEFHTLFPERDWH